MYNLSVDASAAHLSVNHLMVDAGGATPRTPEILNSVIAMTTNPLDAFAFGARAAPASRAPGSTSSDSNSSSSSQLESPFGGGGTPSVQQTCSQLIKAGLKLTIEQKRRHQGDGDDLLDLDKQCKRVKKSECSESEEDKHKQQDEMQNWAWYDNDDFSKLTPEDEERRRRRRERNKIAATKCRLKKRQKTANLVVESETLEAQNRDFKAQLQELQAQKRDLAEILTLHRPHCQQGIAPPSRESLYRLPAEAGEPRLGFEGRPFEFAKGALDEPYPQLTDLDEQAYHYNGQCNYSGHQQGYNNNQNGMENGCMA